MDELRLTEEEQALLDGTSGPGVQRAMEIVATLGRIYGAAGLVPVTHAQIAGVSYKNLGDAGVSFLSEWAGQGARVRVPTTLNPMGMERGRWQAWGIQPAFAGPQLRVIEAMVEMGDHADDELHALSVAGLRAALRRRARPGPNPARWPLPTRCWAHTPTGRADRARWPLPSWDARPRYGYHLDENRRAGFVVEVKCPLRSVADFGALSYVVGKAVGSGVPWFGDLAAWLPQSPADLTEAGTADGHPAGGLANDRLKTLGAGLAAYGAVALYHIAGYTPEARMQGESLIRPDARRLVVDSLAEAYRVMDADPDLRTVDLVTIGCPHASLSEIAEIAAYLKGKTLRHPAVGDHGGAHPATGA